MAKYLFGFLGAGTMGGALAGAAAKSTEPAGIVISDHAAGRAESLAKELGCACADNLTVVKESSYIFLGVKPQMLEDLFGEIGPALKARRDRFILVSMAAGVAIGRIRALAGADYPVVRIMPNTPAAVGHGLVMYCAEGVEARELSVWKEALAGGGRFDAVEERLIDAGSAVTGCGPAFAYMFMEALADGAVACGLPRSKAIEYAAATLSGAAEMVLQTGRHPGALKDDVCSPGGSTIAGVRALEDRGFRAAALEAVVAAFERTLELGK